MSTLFRQQAVEAQKQRLFGSISLAQPLSLHLCVAVILTLVALVVLFLFISEYTRKETVRGFLVPEQGLLKTYAPRSGVIEVLHVREGELVSKGQPLVTLVLRQGTSSGSELGEVLVAQYRLQLQALEDERRTNRLMKQQELKRLKQAIVDIDAQIANYLKVTDTVSDKLELQQHHLSQQQQLHRDGYLSRGEFQDQQQRLLSVKQEQQGALAQLLSLKAERNRLLAEQALLPSQFALKRNENARVAAELFRLIQETETNYRYVIEAQSDGVVSAIPVVEGEFIANHRPLLTLLPRDAVMVAELLLPTRTSGFVKLGDEARLRFDAFPHQRFGALRSEIIRVDKSLIEDGEADLPFPLEEPVYRVRTRLDAQVVHAYGEAFPLRSGMLFEADIILDRRSLIDWLLDPIYSLKGRVG